MGHDECERRFIVGFDVNQGADAVGNEQDKAKSGYHDVQMPLRARIVAKASGLGSDQGNRITRAPEEVHK